MEKINLVQFCINSKYYIGDSDFDNIIAFSSALIKDPNFHNLDKEAKREYICSILLKEKEWIELLSKSGKYSCLI